MNEETPKLYVEEIYEIFLAHIDDELLALNDSTSFRRQLHHYLLGAIVEFKKCKKDLIVKGYKTSTKKIPRDTSSFKLETWNYRGIEIFDEDNVQLEEGKDWHIESNEDGDRILFEFPRIGESTINIYNDGWFSEELTYEEKYILAKGMVLKWLEPKVNREENLKNIITDSDYKKLSSANMLDKMLKLRTKTSEELRLTVIDYTFNGFKGFN